MLARSAEQIVNRRADVGDGFFDFQSSDLLHWLPYDLAKADLKDDVTPEQWDEARQTGDPLDKARDYLPFAWEKANDCRGLSAGRSVSHMKAWLWLAGYDVSEDFDERYDRYGKPCLVVASEIAGFDWRALDDGQWVNSEDGPALGGDEREAMIADAVTFAQSLAPIVVKQPA